MGALVIVRLTPTQRTRMEMVLRAHLGHVVTVRGRSVRCYSTEETSLFDAVRFGPRGYSMAMAPHTAERIATVLGDAGSELADQFRRGQRTARRAASGAWTPHRGTNDRTGV